MLKNFLTLIFIFIPTLSFASVAGEVNKANDLYRHGQYDHSLDLYQQALDQDAQSPVVKYDLGTAYYKKGDYAKALGYLSQAAQDKNIKIKPKAEYNLGNVLYKSGIEKENTNVDEAIKSLQGALGHYGQALTLDPKDQDAVYNQDFVKKEIERLKQKKEQQKQQQQQNQNQKNQQQQNQKDQQGQKNQQNQQSQQNQQQNKQNQQQQDQQNQQKQQEQQKQQKEQAQPSNSQNQKNQQQSAQAQADQAQKAQDRKQAEDMLEEYQENEEPKKLLNYMPKKIDDRPVLKDW